MDTFIKDIYANILAGQHGIVEAQVRQALDSGADPLVIMNEGMIAAMAEVGQLFEKGEYYIPEMLISARAMQSGLAVLRPVLVTKGIKPLGKVVIGTVQGDLHDIGKNLVGMLLEGAGFQVFDLGTDVSPQKFLEAIQTHHPDLVGMSALLTTTMTGMNKTLRFLEENHVRDQVKVIIGGAPVTEHFAWEIGADGSASDAIQAVLLARKMIGLA